MIALYCRLSVADGTGGESDSIANQRLLLADFIASRDDLAGEGHLFFVDDGISGTHAENRPALQRMLAMCREGRISTVVVKDLSRLSRDGLYCVGLVEDELPSLGVRVIAVTDNYDSKRDGKSPAASTELGFRTIMNSWYSRDLSHKVTQSIESERAGGTNLNTVPFGYRKGRGERACEVDEEGAAVVRRIFELACEGLDQGAIAAALNEEGAVTPHNLRALRNPGGKLAPKPNQRWTGTMVKTVVRNPHYKGTLVLGKSKRVEMGLGASRPTDPSERRVFEGAHEAVVDAGTWERAQASMRDTRCGGRREPLGHLFSGLLLPPLRGGGVLQEREAGSRRALHGLLRVLHGAALHLARGPFRRRRVRAPRARRPGARTVGRDRRRRGGAREGRGAEGRAREPLRAEASGLRGVPRGRDGAGRALRGARGDPPQGGLRAPRARARRGRGGAPGAGPRGGGPGA